MCLFGGVFFWSHTGHGTIISPLQYVHGVEDFVAKSSTASRLVVVGSTPDRTHVAAAAEDRRGPRRGRKSGTTEEAERREEEEEEENEDEVQTTILRDDPNTELTNAITFFHGNTHTHTHSLPEPFPTAPTTNTTRPAHQTPSSYPMSQN